MIVSIVPSRQDSRLGWPQEGNQAPCGTLPIRCGCDLHLGAQKTLESTVWQAMCVGASVVRGRGCRVARCQDFDKLGTYETNPSKAESLLPPARNRNQLKLRAIASLNNYGMNHA
jgi:hypothetical protein